MKPQDLLPKRVVNYIQDIGVRALDHLAAHIDSPPPAVPPEGEPPPAAPANATQTLVDHWKGMSPADKQQFVGRVSGSVMEVIVASATLPPGLKKTVKEAEKVIRKRVKKVRKAVAKKKKESPRKKSPKKDSGAKPKKKKKA